MKTTYLLPVFSLFLFFSCSDKTTALIQTWSESDLITNDHYDSLLVVGVSRNYNVRSRYEDKLAKTLRRKYPVKTVSSLEKMPFGPDFNRESFNEFFGEENFDGVLITRVLQVADLDTWISENAGNSDDTPRAVYDNMYNYYNHVAGLAPNRESYEQGQVVVLETNLYDTQTGDLVWICQTKSLNMHKPDKVMREVSKLVAQSMRQERLIP